MLCDAFDREAARGFLDSATVGLPPLAAAQAHDRHLAAWRSGRLDARAGDDDVRRARAAFAAIAGAEPGDVAIGSQVSAFVGLVAASLRAGDEVLVADGDFTSLLFPLLAQEPRGVRVRTVPLERLVEAIGAGTTLVAVSAVQSADGAAVDLDALAAAADHHGAGVLLDATQAAGWLPLGARRFAYVVAGAYKWLLCPRGVAFATVRPDRVERLVPHAANWYACEDPWTSIYGAPLRLADDARRFDLSPAWSCWSAAPPALELLAELGPARIGAHDVALADRLRAGLGLAPARSAIVSVAAPGAAERLRAAGVRASTRAGGARLAFHLYNDEADVDAALAALA